MLQVLNDFWLKITYPSGSYKALKALKNDQDLQALLYVQYACHPGGGGVTFWCQCFDDTCTIDYHKTYGKRKLEPEFIKRTISVELYHQLFEELKQNNLLDLKTKHASGIRDGIVYSIIFADRDNIKSLTVGNPHHLPDTPHQMLVDILRDFIQTKIYFPIINN